MGLQEKIIQLETALTERERQTAELIDHYEAKLEQAGDSSRKTPQSHRGVGEFLSFTWSFAQWRMVVLLALIAAQIRTAGELPPWSVIPFGGAGIWLFLLWCAAEIDQSGWGRLLIKFGIVGAGCVAAYAEPDYAFFILVGMTLLAATRLINNVADRLMEVPAVSAVIGWFV